MATVRSSPPEGAGATGGVGEAGSDMGMMGCVRTDGRDWLTAEAWTTRLGASTPHPIMQLVRVGFHPEPVSGVEIGGHRASGAQLPGGLLGEEGRVGFLHAFAHANL